MAAREIIGSKMLKLVNGLPVILLSQVKRLPNTSRAHAAITAARAKHRRDDTKWRNQATRRNDVRVEDQVSECAATFSVRRVKISDTIFDLVHAHVKSPKSN